MPTRDPYSHRLFQQPWPEGDFRVFQLGFVVDDLLVAAQHWVDVFGVGPFHVMPRVQSVCRYRGSEATWDGSDPIRILTRDGDRTPG